MRTIWVTSLLTVAFYCYITYVGESLIAFIYTLTAALTVCKLLNILMMVHFVCACMCPGNFGAVYRGFLTTETSRPKQAVAVKTLLGNY